MKKLTILLGTIILAVAGWTLFSFNPEDDKIEVTISSQKPATFDLHMYKEGKNLKKLATPYTFTVDKTEAQYIIKSANQEAEVQMEVKRNGKTTLGASWSLIVLTRNNKELSTFGFNLNE
jgi:hypothetical protein